VALPYAPAGREAGRAPNSEGSFVAIKGSNRALHPPTRQSLLIKGTLNNTGGPLLQFLPFCPPTRGKGPSARHAASSSLSSFSLTMM
jgi:hypothetical protein